MCSQGSEECFPSAERAAEYLGALSAVEKLRFPYPLKTARGELGSPNTRTCFQKRHSYIVCFSSLSAAEKLPPAEEEIPPWVKLMFAGMGSLFILVLIAIGMLMTRRKREHSTLWFPEGFFLKKEPSSNKNRREPVGQDALGMK